ncbi:MocR-like pyridoxine biosynthesis transcription factor PdxR [Pseudomonas capsici]|uniref:PLP-dependent aminotransferase family protein n=1 Tax=Pseudomonas capsici TaxID=2810614 RepID=A0ABT3C3U9_9PSED|nr:PLP-dependent aminotransferase family protein [Pseudomonas capsici]MBN6715486.1 PLP-dependent aminotransferase family protein [Pseudomonas capsici]MBN6720395.1 PLP-dependent aminotransferase family protein [Pseudomonas capsici]MBN6725395.1 PLP-dependent aminotransferase family protein [Pseudomonas capsici]MCV4270729.1 PLP-dependent aminotransferase family protein [Pseudomonas capsici]MCV4280923.1 PLP-dependent aminotransferase family protein [Pseudomonas capsici]
MITPLDVAPGQTTPIYRQIYQRFRESIADGRLRPGDRVPAVRALAAELNLARGTVEAAYQLLIGEGYLTARGAVGTFVTPHLMPACSSMLRTPIVSTKYQVNHAGTLPLALQMGIPALDAFPRKLWTRLVGRQLRQAGLEGLVYPDSQGYAPLRSAIAAYLGISRGISCHPDQVFVCAGYRACLDLISRTLMRPDDKCWMEEPGYFMARNALLDAGAELVPVPVDDEGLDVAHGIASCPDASFAVVTPTHQSPLGMSLSLPRRLALLDWANRQGSWIIEDDYDSEYRYQGKPLPSLKSLDQQGRVLYTGTFSKVLFPGLRLAYLVVPAEQTLAFARQADRLHNHCPHLLQATVAAFLNEGHFARHLKKMRSLYSRRRQWLVDALQQQFGDRLLVNHQVSGMHLVAGLREGNDAELALRAQSVGIAVEPLSQWYLKVKPRHGLILGFTNIVSVEQASAVALRLANVMQLK